MWTVHRNLNTATLGPHRHIHATDKSTTLDADHVIPRPILLSKRFKNKIPYILNNLSVQWIFVWFLKAHPFLDHSTDNTKSAHFEVISLDLLDPPWNWASHCLINWYQPKSLLTIELSYQNLIEKVRFLNVTGLKKIFSTICSHKLENSSSSKQNSVS